MQWSMYSVDGGWYNTARGRSTCNGHRVVAVLTPAVGHAGAPSNRTRFWMRAVKLPLFGGRNTGASSVPRLVVLDTRFIKWGRVFNKGCWTTGAQCCVL